MGAKTKQLARWLGQTQLAEATLWKRRATINSVPRNVAPPSNRGHRQNFDRRKG